MDGMKDYTAWLIERHIPGQPPEWAGDDHKAPRMIVFTRNADEAIHFARREDAESIMAILHIGHGIQGATYFASEHLWPAIAGPQLPQTSTRSVSEPLGERPPNPSENATNPTVETQHQGPSKDGGE